MDSKSLGLTGTQAAGLTGIDIGAGSPYTSVNAIVKNVTNAGSLGATNFTDLYFAGPGFAGSEKIKVGVNVSAAADINTLVEAVNAATGSAANGASPQATAFRNAGIRASVVTNSDGSQRLAFDSSNSVFQVQGADRMSNALLGNATSSNDPTGLSLDNTVTGGAATAAAGTAFGASGAGTIKVRFLSGGLSTPVDVELAVAATTTIETTLEALTSAVASNPALQGAGINVSTATAG